ncbi:MAG: asparagine synthase (glutamine-hydrolyzing) [Candidatus Hydrogenedentes bacterium]|nr:asparagine synthase (glutamine-hydrolyzing) [Candidatus Hydrogenedentota bacterium]
MCGIAGMAGKSDADLVRVMTQTLVHRGPDAEGYHCAEGVALGHRRLSIIDRAGSPQPMADAGKRHWLVYNGEIYNFRALRAALEKGGYAFQTLGDTEAILGAYSKYGAACVQHLQGMFAFALWDAQDRSLFLARDPIGVKPLYYAQCGDHVYFASEMKALLACPDVNREMDPEALDDYLTYLYTMPPRTFYRGIRQLPPGHYAVFRDGHLRVERYWRPDSTPLALEEGEWLERVNHQLSETVRDQLVAEVPLGAFLSGGLDSSTIVHNMGLHCARPKTFTIGFGAEGRQYDETAEARSLSKHFDTEHHEIQAHASATAIFPKLLRHFDEPFGNPTALLTYKLCEEVRKHVTVVLSGDGGDENFGGYPRYRGVQVAERYRAALPDALRRYFVNPLVRCLPESTSGQHAWRRLRQFSEGSLLPPVDMYARWISYFHPGEKTALYSDALKRTLAGRDAYAPIHALAAEYRGADPAGRAMYIDIHTFLPNNVLQYGDRMSMAHGLECRVPLADHRLVETLLRMPDDLKVRGKTGKYLMRKAAARFLPAGDVERGKLGFNPPMGVWLNRELRPLVDEYLAPKRLDDGGLFNGKAVRRMIEDHRASRRDYTWHLWALLVLEKWRSGG